MKRIIVDYKKLNSEILDLLIETYPDGYADSDIISFRNLKGEQIEAVEVRTDDTIYLVKIGKKLQQAIEEHEENNFNDDKDYSPTDDLSFDLNLAKIYEEE